MLKLLQPRSDFCYQTTFCPLFCLLVSGFYPCLSACSAKPARPQVRLQHDENGWQLIRDGKPYRVRGAAGDAYLTQLAQTGGNSIRTWDALDIDELLDQAHALGLSVSVGIWLEHERHGYDYDDPIVRSRQLQKVRDCVLRYRDHPALLMWALGNEVELMGDLDKALRAIEEAAAITKELDPHHPTMAVLAEIGSNKAARLRQACPSIDVLGINSYGGAASLPARLSAQGWTGPYVLTEFGPIGPWESGHTAWGAAFEPSSAEKAEMYRRAWTQGVQAESPGRCLGSYAFLWGWKQETTPTWFGMFLDTGERTPAVDVMEELWSARVPEHPAPLVGPMTLELPALTAEPGQTFSARVELHTEPTASWRYAWVVRPESTDRKTGGDAEATPPDLPGLVLASEQAKATLQAPDQPGPYRVYVYVYDGLGGAGTANMPFLVAEKQVD